MRGLLAGARGRRTKMTLASAIVKIGELGEDCGDAKEASEVGVPGLVWVDSTGLAPRA